MANPNSKSAKTMTMFTGLNFNAEPTPAENSTVKKETETPSEFKEAIQNAPGSKGEKGEKVNFNSKRNEQVADVVRSLSSNKSSAKNLSENNLDDNFKENYVKAVKAKTKKRKESKVRKNVYILESMDKKIDDAIEKGEIVSFNDLVITLLEQYLKD